MESGAIRVSQAPAESPYLANQHIAVRCPYLGLLPIHRSPPVGIVGLRQCQGFRFLHPGSHYKPIRCRAQDGRGRQ
jgi:hypothetical protein